MKIDDVIGGQFTHNGVTYQMVEAKMGNTVVWPLSYTYEIVAGTVVVTYSAGSYIYASGSNHATVAATVNVLVNGVVVSTITGAALTPSLPAGDALYADGNEIHGYDLGTTAKAQLTESVTVTYGNASTSVSITQEANVITTESIVPYGSKKYNTAQTTTTYDNYYLSLTSNKYSSASIAAPASGATASADQATLSYVATHYEEDTTPWTQNAKQTYHWSSHPTTQYYYIIEDYYSGSDITRQATVNDTATISGSATGFARSGMNVSIASEGTTEYTNGRSCTYTATVNKHGGGTKTDTVTLYQAQNIKTNDQLIISEKSYGSPYETTSDGSYSVTLNIGNYTSESIQAPASGGTATITVTASHIHTVTVQKDWTRTAYHYYTWSSGDHSQTSPAYYDNGTEVVSTTPTTVTDYPTPTSSQSWASISGSTLTIASRGTTYSSTNRTATISVSNGGVTAEKTVWQAANGRTQEYIYDLAIQIAHSGPFPAGGGNYSVTAHSYRVRRYTYDSGAIDDSTSNYTAQLTKTNCTSTQANVYGQETFSIEVAPNTSTTDVRMVSLTLSAGGKSVTVQQMQETLPIPTNEVATFLPYIPTTGTNKGKVYYTFTIDSGSVTSATLTGVYFKYQRNGGSTQSVSLGSMSVSETSSPVLLTNSSIPRFNNNRTVKAWFEITGSIGSFDTIHANGSTYYTYVEFSPYTPPTPDT